VLGEGVTSANLKQWFLYETTDGKICLLDIPYCKENNVYVREGEDWRCAVKEERENCIIVQPITRTLTAE
jgi:hypothetical protein